MKIYPLAQFNFIVEHSVTHEEELSKIKTIAIIPGVKTFIIDSKKTEDIQFYEDSQGQHVKNIRIITTATLDNNDFQLLQKGSVVNYSSGDISTSDVLAMGKIPILNIEAINLLFRFFKEKMEKFSIIEGNEQYQTLVATWRLAVENFTYEAKRIFSKESATKINSLQLLGSPKWKEFEHKFTDWLKENNQTEKFMRDKAEAIISGAEEKDSQLCIIA